MTTPLFVGPYSTGVQQNLKPFMILEEAFPNLLNCFVFRGRVERKSGYNILGRLSLVARGDNLVAANYTLSTQAMGGIYNNANILADADVDLQSEFPNATIVPGSVAITVGAVTFSDPGEDGSLVGIPGFNFGTINYATGALVLDFNPIVAPTNVVISFKIYPTLPVMGIRKRETPSILSQDQTIFFDTVYAYQYKNNVFSELPSILPTQWHGTDTNFFWTINYQVNAQGLDVFWATNFYSANLNAANVTLFANRMNGPPSTVDVTAAGNTFVVGDAVTFTNLSGAGSANNGKTGIVTVAGNPTFTISNPGTAVFVNGIVTGYAIGGDSIRYYTGSSSANNTWTYFYPMTNATNVVITALIILPYKDRLVLLNTVESTDPTVGQQSYTNRARWSQNGTQKTSASLDTVNGWLEQAGRGGFRDAPTDEQIVSAGFVKDQLIVYFENSTWQLVYNSNEVYPFIWQRINAELGAESTFSAVTFDKGLVAFGNVGVHASNGVSTVRIDEEIPDEVYNIHQSVDGPLRTYGIRDFFLECVYFSYASSVRNTTDLTKIFYPNRIMVYNYRNGTFSFFDDNATCFGYFQRTSSLTWNDLNANSQFSPWNAWNEPWNSGVLQAGFPSIAFGNQQGFVEEIDPTDSSNAPSLYIENIVPSANGATITSPQHNLFNGQYVTINGTIGLTLTPANPAPNTSINGNSYEIFVIDANTIYLVFPIIQVLSGTYGGSGTMTVLSNVVMKTKMFTPFWSQGKRYNLKYVDILFDRTGNGEMQVDLYVDFSSTNTMTDVSSGTVLGLPVISTAPELPPTGANQPVAPYYAFQKFGDQIWKRFYTFATGETFQLQLSMNDLEMRTPIINESDIVVHGMIFFFEESGEFY